MAKKIAKVPLGEDFLAGYKPVTPDFADIPMENDVAPEPLAQSKGFEKEKDDNTPRPPNQTSMVFLETFLTASPNDAKHQKVYLTDRHLSCLKDIVQAYRTITGTVIPISAYVWNILENHFSTYKNDIAGLMDQCTQQRLERFK